MRLLPIPSGREVRLEPRRIVTAAPSPHGARSTSRVLPDGSVERLSQDGWIRISGPDRAGPVILPPEPA